MLVRFISVVLLVALVVQVAAAESGVDFCAASKAWSMQQAVSSDAGACFAPDALTAVRDACAGITDGQVCLAAGDVQTSPAAGLIVPGAVVDFAGIDSLSGTNGSLVIMKMQADLPPGASPVELVLFGNTSIANAVTGLSEPFPTAIVKNGPANILNLRATPSTDGAVVTTMKWNQELTADGRSSDGTWLRVQTDKGAAWVFASLVSVSSGDTNALYVLDSPVTQHLQSLSLESADAASATCGGGLLVQAANDASAHLQVNGALLTFSTATLVLRAQPDSALIVQVLDGSASLTANGTTMNAESGAQLSVALDDLQADAAPELQEGYAFTSLLSLPLAALPQESMSCVVGITSGTAALYRAPGGQPVGELNATSHAAVVGQAAVDGTPWWLIDDGTWIAQDAVQTAGMCEAVPEAPPVQQQVSQPVQTSSFAHDQVPDGRSIWQAHTGVDNLSGVCTAPPIAQCDHLAAVTTQPDGTITWLGQEPQPYTLTPTGANSYHYQGRNQLNNANLSLTVTFTSPTYWVGTMQIVYDADSGCTHQFNYTADRIR